MAGATTTRSAAWPRRVCGIGSASSHSDVCAGSEPARRRWCAPTKCERALGEHRRRRGRRRRPGGGRPRGLVGGDAAGHAEDDALPGEHGRGRSRRWDADSAVRAVGGVGLVGLDLGGRASTATILSAAISSKAIDSGLRATEVTWGGTMVPEALAELAEVRVDLPGPLGAQGDEA